MKRTLTLAMTSVEVLAGLSDRLGSELDIRVNSTEDPETLVSEIAKTPPEVLIVGTCQGRTKARELIEGVRRACPETLVILHSPEPAEGDAEIVEKGIFYYAAGASLDTLADAVHAALDKCLREKQARKVGRAAGHHRRAEGSAS